MSPEVLMYIQKVKTYFSENDEIRKKHFYTNGNEKDFFEMLEKVAEENFKEKNEPELSIEQFEKIRQVLMGKPPVTLFVMVHIQGDHYGYYSLN
jgi:hypothetical protein